MLRTELQDAGAGATCGSESAATSESEDGEVQSHSTAWAQRRNS